MAVIAATCNRAANSGPTVPARKAAVSSGFHQAISGARAELAEDGEAADAGLRPRSPLATAWASATLRTVWT